MTTIQAQNKNEIAGYEHSFQYSFRIFKKHFFFIDFGQTKGNKFPYFATSAGILNHVRSDYNISGQCQSEVFGKYKEVKKFFEKWDQKHCESLTIAELEELKTDIEVLKEKYDYIENNMFFEIVNFDRAKSK